MSSNLHFLPLLPPINAEPDVGCLLLHITARSYGANHTHRLCRTPLLVTLAEISSILLLASQSGLSVMPKDFLLRTYLYIHSPTIVCAIESTTDVCCIETASELVFMCAFCRLGPVAIDGLGALASRGSLYGSERNDGGSAGIWKVGISGTMETRDSTGGDRLRLRLFLA